MVFMGGVERELPRFRLNIKETTILAGVACVGLMKHGDRRDHRDQFEKKEEVDGECGREDGLQRRVHWHAGRRS